VDSVDVSTDEEDAGRPSKLEGNKFIYRYATLKRAAEDDSAGPSGITTDTVRTTETPIPQLTQGIVTQNRFACLTQEKVFNIDDVTQGNTQLHTQHTPRSHKHMQRDVRNSPGIRT